MLRLHQCDALLQELLSELGDLLLGTGGLGAESPLRVLRHFGATARELLVQHLAHGRVLQRPLGRLGAVQRLLRFQFLLVEALPQYCNLVVRRGHLDLALLHLLPSLRPHLLHLLPELCRQVLHEQCPLLALCLRPQMFLLGVLESILQLRQFRQCHPQVHALGSPTAGPLLGSDGTTVRPSDTYRRSGHHTSSVLEALHRDHLPVIPCMRSALLGRWVQQPCACQARPRKKVGLGLLVVGVHGVMAARHL
mmetsp:Transcript_29276/g.97288  ORF Transcript_29276/g.97288 Transcript_29276/m.97288 type:complete len:251 (+) Transcript_29276:10074-10826(+)